MKSFEDHFSAQARKYALYRPQYPSELFIYLASLAPARQFAWDCGTGNGQAARELVKHFDRVLATDPSPEQIAQAGAHERIDYRVERAEEVKLEAQSVDLVTVAQAVHWFDLEEFYRVVQQAGKPEGVIAVWMYHLAVIDPGIDSILEHYYADILSGYWPERLHYLADRYRSLPFPFEEISAPGFEMRAGWDLDQLAGFLDSWSATQRYQRERGGHPLSLIWPELVEKWGNPAEPKQIRWPLYLRVARIK